MYVSVQTILKKLLEIKCNFLAIELNLNIFSTYEKINVLSGIRNLFYPQRFFIIMVQRLVLLNYIT